MARLGRSFPAKAHVHALELVLQPAPPTPPVVSVIINNVGPPSTHWSTSESLATPWAAGPPSTDWSA